MCGLSLFWWQCPRIFFVCFGEGGTLYISYEKDSVIFSFSKHVIGFKVKRVKILISYIIHSDVEAIYILFVLSSVIHAFCILFSFYLLESTLIFHSLKGIITFLNVLKEFSYLIHPQALFFHLFLLIRVHSYFEQILND